MAEDQALKIFLADAKKRAANIVAMDHVGADIKAVIRDLLQLSENFRGLLIHTQGQDADTRLLKKRLAESKAEAKGLHDQHENLKQIQLQLIGEIKIVGVEATQIFKRNAVADGADLVSVARIKASSQKMAEIVIGSNRNQGLESGTSGQTFRKSG